MDTTDPCAVVPAVVTEEDSVELFDMWRLHLPTYLHLHSVILFLHALIPKNMPSAADS